jgi:hypothetical protein
MIPLLPDCAGVADRKRFDLRAAVAALRVDAIVRNLSSSVFDLCEASREQNPSS